MLLLYILWDDWPIFMISASNEQLQQELEYTLLKPDCHSFWVSKMQSGREDTLEEWYAIKFYFKVGKMSQKHMECFRLLFGYLAWIEHQFLSGIRDSRKARRDDEKCGRSKELNRPELIGYGYYDEVLREFRKRFHPKRWALFKSGQWHFHQDNAPVHNSILVTEYLTKMGIKTVPHPPNSPDVPPSDFWLFPKLRGCRYETIEEMKEAVTKVIVTLTQDDFDGAFQKLLERYNKCIATRGDYFEWD